MNAINVKVTDVTREDLREYSDSELSLRVFNDEYLYERRHWTRLKGIVDEMFIYSVEQWDELQVDLYDDLMQG